MPTPSTWPNPRSLPASSTVPPTMARPHRSLAVRSTPRGLIVRPYDDAATGSYRGAAVLVEWRADAPVPLDDWQDDPHGDPDDMLIQVDGIAGLLKGFSDNYLILITDSSHAATLPDQHSSKVRTVSSLVAIPLASPEAAQPVLAKQAARQARYRESVKSIGNALQAVKAPQSDTSDSEESDDEDEAVEADSVPAAPVVNPKRPFWQRAFSRNRAQAPQPGSHDGSVAADQSSLPSSESPPQTTKEPPRDPNEAQPSSTADTTSLPTTVVEATNPTAQVDDADVRESQRELDNKLVAELIRTFRGLYFSFEADITRTMQAKATESKGDSFNHLPLWRRADKRFWFNAHLMSSFVAAGLHSYILVLQQGFAQEVTVALPLQPYESLSAGIDPSSPTSIDLTLVLISRRSIERPGLRYQRRGINPSGGVANFVETEFTVSCVRDGTKHHCSFVQIRGSIPAYWSQSPWALKPPPVLERTPKDTNAAMEKHIDGLESRYGRLVLVNLAEQTGKEGAVVAAFRGGIESLNRPEDRVRYLEWDFHHLTRGMKYDKIADDLIGQKIRDDLEELRTFWSTPEETYSLQTGVCRINCIDSLDRTNVVQSAISRWVLNRHLVHLGIASGETEGMHDALDVAFNALWADNGDAISREYAGTSALKGDFTRTGKRNLLGALNDASNSIVRLGNSVVTDFFKQASLDYILGVNRYAFEEFSERLETSDPREILRLSQIRQEAVETSAKEVLWEGEDKLDGWTLLSPSEIDTIRPGRGGKFEEKVFLLSNRAVYVVEFEYTLQKVVSSVRIPTGSILSIQTGAYILSSLDASTSNVSENYGMILRYAAIEATEKVRTYTLQTTTTSPQKDRDSVTSKNVGSRLSASMMNGLKPLRLPGAISTSNPTPTTTKNKTMGTPTTATPGTAVEGSDRRDEHFFAFKALKRDAIKISNPNNGQSQIIDSRSRDGHDHPGTKSQTAKELVKSIVHQVQEEALKFGAVDEEWIQEKDIISLAEAKAQTPLVDKLSHALYRAIWL
ncbi:uncharacterized protein JCM15063_000776 [Sporobolomyces koalae]|uniref:uncharacterized protein n=1 Tax=Sporobolomyces koalae TaxID=500713 RepID=UPI003171E247